MRKFHLVDGKAVDQPEHENHVQNGVGYDRTVHSLAVRVFLPVAENCDKTV